jgi:hypothetical protein
MLTALQGAFENGLIHGKGLFVWSDGVQFEGDFVNNTISGSGVYRWPDGRHVADPMCNGYL